MSELFFLDRNFAFVEIMCHKKQASIIRNSKMTTNASEANC